MKNFSVRKWVDEIICSPQTVAIPIMTHPGIELTGKKVIDAVTNAEVHSSAIKALNDKYPAAASTVIMDLTVEAEAFGCEIRFSDDEVPTVSDRLLKSASDISSLKVPSLDNGRVKEYLKANQLTASSIDSVPVLAGCIGPFSLAGRLYDMTEIMMAMYIEPDAVHELLTKCSEFIKSYILAIKETGANGVIIAEPAAGLLSNADCKAFSSVYLKEIIASVKDDTFAVILHNCGNGGHCTEATVFTEADGYHFGNKIDMIKALESCPNNVLVMGNLDPVGVFKSSTPEEIYSLTASLMESCKSYPNFVISSGCDTPPEVPFENIEAFYRAVSDSNKKQL